MSLALVTLVVVLGQSGGSGKVQVIKGKKSSPASKMKTVEAPELAPQPIIDKSKPPTDAKPAASANANDKTGADQDAQAKEQSPEEKAKAEKQASQKKQIEKISTDNQKLWQQSADALAGDTNP